MRICGIRIQNYRSIEDADITLGDTTRIIGANGAGKSTILKALELFYTGRPYLVFRELGIPTFVMWDGDKPDADGKNGNHRMQMMLGRAHEEVEDYPSLLKADHACFEINLEKTIQAEIGVDLWNDLLDDLKKNYGVRSNKEAQKIPKLMTDLLHLAAEKGKNSPTLGAIIDNIVALKKSSAANSGKTDAT